MFGTLRHFTLCLALLYPAMAGAQEGPVVFGAVVTLTGEGASGGEAVALGMRAAVDAINAEGGVLVAGVRRPLVLEIMDDRGSPLRAAALAEVLVWRRSVSLFLGGGRAELTALVAETAAVLERPTIDLQGLDYGPSVSGFAYSVVPYLEDRAATALTAMMLGYRMAGTVLADVEAAALATDPLERAALSRSLVASGFGHGAEDGGAVDLHLLAPGMPRWRPAKRLLQSLCPVQTVWNSNVPGPIVLFSVSIPGDRRKPASARFRHGSRNWTLSAPVMPRSWCW